MDQEHEQAVVKPGYWAVIPAAVRYDPDLSCGAKLLYAEISSLTDQTGYCWATNAYFQALYTVTERTVIRWLKDLEDRGYILTENRQGGKARRRIYVGISPGSELGEPTLTKMSAYPDKNVSVTLTKMSERTIKENKKENNTPKSPQGGEGGIWDPEAFERFWKLYPKKKDKAKAIREWNKLKADRKLMRVMSAALRAQMASEEWQRDNGRAIPYPCRWLSHRRWEDELEAAAAPEREEAEVWI